ncbi:hypothetical protein, partial [Paenibacillus sp. ISL-20]|uniref:hypothetical protein n=1 Tax=Paenibacillus sp. ISL-20 TaxID=2819163 RepID=UPI001BE736BA
CIQALVNEELRKRYEEVYEKIEIQKVILMKGLIKPSGLKDKIDEAITQSFAEDKRNILNLLVSLKEQINDSNFVAYSHVIYKKIFDEKVIAFLETDDTKNQIIEYIEQYDNLVTNSAFLKREFNHYNASVVQKNLSDNGFFKANHTINLIINGEKTEINDAKTLSKKIEEEKERILNDSTLKSMFNAIEKKITNAQLREFREYLIENPDILTELGDLNALSKKLWISYLKDNKESYENLLSEYTKGQQMIKEITEIAKKERTDWENVIDIFNRRFYVPYRLSITNKEDIILKDELPSISYLFKDREDNAEEVKEDLLLKVLSQGESRALYLLNIIFEIQSRNKQGIKTLFIIDDVADSFDYKNKYAIIEYLKEISEHSLFSSIILTHNFDFFRTVQERVCQNKWDNAYMAIKEKEYIHLEKIQHNYIKDPFKNWKAELKTNQAKLIASITFARNVADYIGDDVSQNKLTSILHIKPETFALTLNDLQDIYKSVFRDLETLVFDNPNQKIIEMIFEHTDRYVEEDIEVGMNLENKIALSIAIRLKAEIYMISKINHNEFVTRGSNQTGKLFGKFRKDFPEQQEIIQILGRVNIMTPENIHLNSFMYEPILDMSDHHLKQLYIEVNELLDKEGYYDLMVAATFEN